MKIVILILFLILKFRHQLKLPSAALHSSAEIAVPLALAFELIRIIKIVTNSKKLLGNI